MKQDEAGFQLTTILAVRERIIEIGSARHFPKGTIITSAGHEGENLYLIISGEVKISNVSSQGHEVWHTTLGPDEIFGEMAMLTGKSRKADAEALVDTYLIEIPCDRMMALLNQNADASFWLLTVLANRLDAANDLTRSVLSLRNPERIRRALLALATDEPAGHGGLSISPVPNWSEFARRLSISREQVSREISALIASEKLSKHDGLLVIEDPEFFRRTSNI